MLPDFRLCESLYCKTPNMNQGQNYCGTKSSKVLSVKPLRINKLYAIAVQMILILIFVTDRQSNCDS